MTFREFYKNLPIPDRKLLFAVIVGVIVLTVAPYAYGALSAGDGYVYLWMNPVTSAGDSNAYYSLMEQVKHGKVFLENLYTNEPQTGSMFHPLWLVLGAISGLFDISAPVVYQLARVFLGALFLVYAYYWVSEFVHHNRSVRNIAIVLLGFSSGIGWIFATSVGHLDAVKILYLLPTDQWVSESNTFLTILHSPLFILSQLLMLYIIHRVVFEDRIRDFRMTIVAMFALALMHPYDVVILAALLPIFLSVRHFREGRGTPWNLRAWKRILMLGAAAVPAAVYLYVSGVVEIAIGGWTRQNVTISPLPHSYILGFGLLLAFAVAGWAMLRKSKTTEDIAVLTWPIIAIILMYIPIQINRRFVNGFHIPLTILAAIAVEYALRKWKVGSRIFSWSFALRAAATWVVLLGFFMGNMILVGNAFYWQADKEHTIYYLPNSVANGMDWLAKNAAPTDSVISTTFHGNLLPARTGLRTYAGHGHQTVHWSEKRDLVHHWFYKTNLQDEKKSSFLHENGIDWVFFSQPEDDLGNFAPDEKKYLQRAYYKEGVAIYRVILQTDMADSDGLAE